MLKKITLILLLSTPLFSGNQFEMNFSGSHSRLSFDLDVANIIPAMGESSYYLGLSTMGIGTDPITGDPINRMYGVNLYMQSILNPFEELTVQVGMKALYSTINSENLLVLPVGFSGTYIMPSDKFQPIIKVSGFYGSAHLALLDTTNYFEYSAALGLQLDNFRQFFETALSTTLSYFHVFAGYTSITMQSTTTEIVITQGIYGGMKIAF